MKVYELVWSPTGQVIATVTASTMKAAKRKAPAPYSRYRGEIYAREVGKANPSEATRARKRVARRLGYKYTPKVTDWAKEAYQTRSTQRRREARGGAGPKNPGGRKLTKLERKVRAAKKAADRRVATALAKYLRQANPGKKIVAAQVQKLKGGAVKITPVVGRRTR
jgi:hypothetical protein